MFEAYLNLDDRELTGTLDFYVLKTVQDSLKKNGQDLTIPEICKKTFEGDALVISTILINSVIRKTDVTPTELLKLRETDANKNEENISDSFVKIFDYLKDLFEECFPTESLSISEDDEESLFEDEFEDEKDYDFALMEYMWTTYLQRTDFWKITPKKYMEQIKIFSKHALKNNKSRG